MTRAFRFPRQAWLWVLALLLMDSGVALAQLAVTTTPSQLQLPITRTTPTFSVRWTIVSPQDIDPPLVSTEGVFRLTPTGPPLGSVPRTFTITMPSVNGFLVQPVNVPETFRVPPDVVNAARAAGASSIVYTRTWFFISDTGGAISADGLVNLNFTGGLGGPFQITRFDLQFDDRSSLRIVRQLEQFRAIATVNYQGTGLVTALWEVASPAQSRGLSAQVGFRILKRENIRFDGPGRIFLKSPFLPSQESGLHAVRLRFIEPDTAFQLDPIGYFVAQGESATYGGVPAPLAVSTPPHLAMVDGQTSFSWQPVADAAAYQVEIFAGEATQTEAPRTASALESGKQRATERSALIVEAETPVGEFVTGTVLPGRTTGTLLSPPLLRELNPGHRYLWRVRAIATDGSIIAESPVLEFVAAP